MPSAEDPVLLDVTERIATVTLNRPEARNALSGEVLRLLPKLLLQADADPDVDVLVLTGTDPAFCAGLDLKELGSGGGGVSGSIAREDGHSPLGGRGPMPKLTKPLIGAINGVAVTGGFELALNCDFLVASERAKFGDTHARVGVMPGWGLTVLLPQAIGVRRAREMSFTGNFIDADEAFKLGPRQPRRRRTTSCCRSPASWPRTSPATTRTASARSARPTPPSPTTTTRGSRRRAMPGHGSAPCSAPRRWPSGGWRSKGADARSEPDGRPPERGRP